MKNPHLKIVEVGPRDGLQNESVQLSASDRAQFIRLLKAAGLKYMEGGSFVSPKAIPQMQGSEDVWNELKDDASIELSFLVANEKGLERALQSKVHRIAVFTATSDSFTKKNINMTVAESLERFSKIAEKAAAEGFSVRGYVSTAFGCPYEGAQPVDKLEKVIERLFQMGCNEVSVGDTIGVANPGQSSRVFSRLAQSFDISKIAAHMHDTRGMAVANLCAAFEQGVRIADSSVGGLGGCPYAKGSSGNVATEEVVLAAEGLGYETGVAIPVLLEAAAWIEKKIGKELSSRLYRSRPSSFFYEAN